MPGGQGPLSFDALLTTSDFKKGLSDLENRIKGFTGSTRKEADEIDAIFKKLGGAIGGYFAVTELKGLVTNIVKVRGEFQQLEIAFTTMLKSKAKADALMGQIVDFAGNTPFSLTEVATGAKQLLAYGSSAEKVVDEIKTLGDVAAGVSAPLGDLIYLYGTLRTQGRAYTTDIRQFAGRGIPIYEELAKVLKINTAEVNNFVESGRVGFKEVEQAFRNMTSAGGIFEGLTEKQSKSLTGLVSNFKDALDRMFNDMGKSQEGTIAEIIKGATSVVNNYEDVVDVLKVLVSTYGLYKAAVITTSIIQSRANVASAISLYLSLAKNIRNAADAMVFLNLVTGLNPYVAVAAAVTAAVVAFKVFSDETKKLTTATELLNEANKDVKAEISKQKGEITSLISVLKNQNIAESVRFEAYEKIKSISPDILKGLSFEAAKTADLTKEVNNYIIALEKKLRLEATSGKFLELLKQQNDLEDELINSKEKLKELEKIPSGALSNSQTGIGNNTFNEARVVQARQKIIDLENKFNQAQEETDKIRQRWEKTASLTDKDLIKQRIDNLNQRLAITKKYSPEYRKIEEEIKSLNISLSKSQPKTEKSFSEKLADANDYGNLKLLKSLQKTDAEVEAYVKKITDTRGKYKQGTKEYDSLNSLLNEVKKQQKQFTSGETIAPFGSVDYWKTISKKAGDMLEKINPFAKDNQGEIAKYQAQKLEADKKAEQASKLVSVKSFDDTLEEKRKLYAEFEQWQSLKGKETAQKDFASLLSAGQSYKAYLDREIATLEAKIQSGTADNNDRSNLLKLKQEDVKIFEEGLEEKKKQYELYNLWLLHTGKEAADKQFEDLIKQGGSIEEFLKNRILGLRNKISVGVAVDSTDYTELVRYETELDNINNGFEKYKQRISDAADELTSLTEKIQFFQAEQAKVSPFDTARILFLTTQRLQAERERKDFFKSFFVENNSNESKRLAITEKYNDLRAQADKDYNDGKLADYIGTLAAINNAEKDEFANIETYFKGLADVIDKELSRISNNGSISELNGFLEQAYQQLNQFIIAGETSGEAFEKLAAAIKGAQTQLQQLKFEAANKLIGLFGQVGQELQGMSGDAGQFGKVLIFASSKALTLLRIIENAKKTTDGFASNLDAITFGASFVLDYINNLLQQKKEEEKAQLSFNSAMNNYNHLLTERIRLESIVNSNGFTKNYTGQFEDTAEALVKATFDYNDAVKKIAGAQGDVIQKVGGIFGFGGQEIRMESVTKRFTGLIDAAGNLNKEMAQALVNSELLTDQEKVLLENALSAGEELEKIREQGVNIVQDLVGQISDNLRNSLIQAFKDGTSAAQAFGKSVAEIMADVATKLVFDKIMGPVYDRLSAEINQSLFGEGGDRNIVDDLERYNDYGLKAAEAVYDATKKIQDTVKNVTGIDPFANSASTGLSGTASIKGITEETASRLEAQWNAMRISQASILDINRSQLLAISEIASNSRFLQRLELLTNIEKNISKINSAIEIRSGGLT